MTTPLPCESRHGGAPACFDHSDGAVGDLILTMDTDTGNDESEGTTH